MNDPLDEDPGQVNVARIDGTRFHQLFDLGDGDATGHGSQRVEVHVVFSNTRVSAVSTAFACTSAKSAVSACSSTYRRKLNSLTSLGGEAIARLGRQA